MIFLLLLLLCSVFCEWDPRPRLHGFSEERGDCCNVISHHLFGALWKGDAVSTLSCLLIPPYIWIVVIFHRLCLSRLPPSLSFDRRAPCGFTHRRPLSKVRHPHRGAQLSPKHAECNRCEARSMKCEGNTSDDLLSAQVFS